MKLKDLAETVRMVAPTGSLMLVLDNKYPKDTARPESALSVSLEKAKKQLETAKKMMENPGSDMAYWTYRGVKVGWQVAVNLLTATKLVGKNNLPDIPPPDTRGDCVMDAQSHLEKWSWEVLSSTKGFKDYFKCAYCSRKWANGNKHHCDGCGKDFCDDCKPSIGCQSKYFGKWGYWCNKCYKLVEKNKNDK